MRRIAFLGIVVLFGCDGPLAKIDAIRDGLAKNDAQAIGKATGSLPKCTDLAPYVLAPKDPSPRDAGCFGDIANALGSKKGFSTQPLDQASAAAAAAVIVRDGRGDLFAQPDIWLTALKTSQGAGFDALRLAIAKKMVEAAPVVGRKIEEEKDARAAMKGVAAAIPGACPTYRLLGTDTENADVALTPDHSACVQHDLQRREGPGGLYGVGVFRALEGSLSLWRETERALRLGRDRAAPSTKGALDTMLKTIEETSQKIQTKKLDSTEESQTMNYLGDVHGDAGVQLFRRRDGGADDASAPRATDGGGM